MNYNNTSMTNTIVVLHCPKMKESVVRIVSSNMISILRSSYVSIYSYIITT